MLSETHKLENIKCVRAPTVRRLAGCMLIAVSPIGDTSALRPQSWRKFQSQVLGTFPDPKIPKILKKNKKKSRKLNFLGRESSPKLGTELVPKLGYEN